MASYGLYSPLSLFVTVNVQLESLCYSPSHFLSMLMSSLHFYVTAPYKNEMLANVKIFELNDRPQKTFLVLQKII